MTPTGMKIPIILLLSSSLLSLGRSGETDEKRQIHMDKYSLGWIAARSSIATRADGSLVILSCKPFYIKNAVDCAIHVVGLSGPVITYPISYKDNLKFVSPLITTSFDMIENMVYLLIRDPIWHRWNDGCVIMLAVDLTSGTVSKFNFPSDLLYLEHDVSLIVDHNGANLILSNASVCGDHMPRCKFTFNKRGELLGGPVSFPIESGYKIINFPRVVESADKGVLVFQYDLYGVNSIYIDASGNTTVLHRFQEFPTGFFDTGDLYLACEYIHNLRFLKDCVQYDWKQNETVQLRLSPSNFSIEGDQQLIASVASLDKSTFLVAYVDCREDRQPGCSALVSSITSDGKVLKTTRLFDDLHIKINNFVKPAIVEVEYQFCFYIFYADKPKVGPSDEYVLNVHTKCIPRSDL